MTRYSRREILRRLSAGAGLAAGAGLFGPTLLFAEDDPDMLAIEAQQLIMQGKLDEAIEKLKLAVGLDPKNEFAHGMLGQAYKKKGMTAEAIAEFQEVLKLNPEDFVSKVNLEMLTQKPVKAKPPKVEKPLTPLEKAAQKEEEEYLARAKESQKGLAFKINRLVIDPGHGGLDSGAVGLKGLRECDVNLDIGRRLLELIRKNTQIKAWLTRDDDYFVELGERTATANQRQADLFVSLHINANENRKPRGFETYYCAETASNAEAARVAKFENSVAKYDTDHSYEKISYDLESILFKVARHYYWGESERFAKGVQAGFKENLTQDRHLRHINSANFFVLRQARMPSILVESGFISNPDEEAWLRKPENVQRIAQSIFDMIVGKV